MSVHASKTSTSPSVGKVHAPDIEAIGQKKKETLWSLWLCGPKVGNSPIAPCKKNKSTLDAKVTDVSVNTTLRPSTKYISIYYHNIFVGALKLLHRTVCYALKPTLRVYINNIASLIILYCILWQIWHIHKNNIIIIMYDEFG